MLLNKDSIIVLKYLHKNNFEFDTVEELSKHLPQLSTADVEGALWHLDKCGYRECDPADDTVYELRPTYDGLKYTQFFVAEIKDFLFRSFFVPIAVSIVTSMFMYWLMG